MLINRNAYEKHLGAQQWTTKELCDKAGLRPATVSKILNGGSGLPKTIGAIASALGVDISELILVEEKEGK